jgi:hypothetical protein
MAGLKFTLSGLVERYALPPRPSSATATVLDAHRQTAFLLADDVTLFERAMNLQLSIVAANQKKRDPHTQLLFAYWSRVFSLLADACAAVFMGSYVSAPPLVRAACDCVAAQRSLISDGFTEAEQWHPTAVAQAKEQNALALDIGRFRAGSVMAEDEVLGRLYRVASDLSMPHFGSTLLQVAPDTTLQRASVSFAEGVFHLAWAELTMGWLLALVNAQLETAAGCDLFAISKTIRGDIEHANTEIQAILSSRRRCYVEELPGGGYLVHNYRRTATGQPKRVILRA